MFSDGLSENVPYWVLKLSLCFSTVIVAGPDGASLPLDRVSSVCIGGGGRADPIEFFHCSPIVIYGPSVFGNVFCFVYLLEIIFVRLPQVNMKDQRA